MERKTVSGMVLTLLLIGMLTFGFDNQKTKFVTAAISAPSEAQVGIRTGDWIKYNYTVTGAPSGTTLPTQMTVEFLSVEGTNATVRVTIHMSNGTEQRETKTVDVVAGNRTFGAFPGSVIPANSAKGDSVYINGYGNTTIAGEATRTYAGESRTVVYATFSHGRARCYWDKQTGVMVEASMSKGDTTETAKATETSMWGFVPFWMQWWFWAIVAVVILVLAGAVYMKKRKPPATPSISAEGTNTTRATDE